MKKTVYPVLLLIIFLGACSNKQEEKEEKKVNTTLLNEMKDVQSHIISVDNKALKTAIDEIPSSLEISIIIKNTGAVYNNKLLNNPKNYQYYDSDYKKGLNLGIYSTDMGYISLYEENQDGTGYVVTMRNIANDLNVGKYFDFKVINSLTLKRTDLDSLLLVTTQSFNRMNQQLRSERKADLSGLIVAGSWVEVLYIAIKTYRKTGNKTIREKIGEQKIVFGRIHKLFELLSNMTSRVSAFYLELTPILKAYQNITVEKVYKKATTVEKDGVLYIEDKSESIVKMNDAALEGIEKAINDCRNEIVSMQ